jgi:hypothetical protein
MKLELVNSTISVNPAIAVSAEHIKREMIILVTGTTIEPYAQNWKECSHTWIPILRALGYNVMVAIGDPNLENYYKIDGSIIWFKAEDTKMGLYDKSIKLPIKWILEETNFKYYFRIDSDSFVHPHRFDNMILHNFEDLRNIQYMGCCHPYHGWNPNDFTRFFICKKKYMASGCAYMINREAMVVAQKNMRIVEDPLDYTIDDWVLGRAMWENGIPLLHDSRILFESPHQQLTVGPCPIPNIAEPTSHLAIQHYMNGHMFEALKTLGYAS